MSCFPEIKWWYRVAGFSDIAETEYELVEEECEPCLTVNTESTLVYNVGSGELVRAGILGYCSGYPIYKSENLPIKENKQTFMSKATTYIKNLTLSADEKLLRKYGFKDDCGDYTSEGVELVKAKLVKDNEDYLITIAKGLEEEANKNK